MFGVDFPDAVGALVEVFSARILFLGTGELLPEGVALFPGPSSQEDVLEPDSSSDDNVGGWSPVAVDWNDKVRIREMSAVEIFSALMKTVPVLFMKSSSTTSSYTRKKRIDFLCFVRNTSVFYIFCDKIDFFFPNLE